ncbi:MAG: tripartite tricarboxylate transporter permease [Synergistaceae bacterium]|jgi:putative tricarboxylic transport membrane protein|nr:tripartite tricarboxylate transporter permease [Synergistaceae bacterium]
MSDFQMFLTGFITIFHIKYVLLMFGGVFFGIVVGALPGLTASMGIALMLPFTYNMEALSALVLLLSIYSGGIFGGSITAILINTPGAPSNVATVMDGYPMTLRGRSEEALGLALYGSVIGGLIGCVFLVSVMKPLANISLKFGPSEILMVAVFGLTVIGSLGDNIFKSIYSGLFGILVGTVGSSASGALRGTMGSMYLIDGVPMIPALIGLLALPELFTLASREYVVSNLSKRFDARRILSTISEIVKRPVQTFLCSMLGVIVGVIPAAGSAIACILSYNQAKQWSRKSKLFGTGIPEGIIAAETANNASEGGALATMLVLGIPGSGSTAMLIGALILQGWVPGPRLFLDNKEIVYASISSLFVQQFVMLFIGMACCVFAAKIISIPTKFLLPTIILFTILGAFSTRNALFDANLMMFLGLVGWFMKQNDFPTMPLILGIILGPIADHELLRTIQLFSGHYADLWYRPITVFLLVLSVFSVVLPLIMKRRKERRGVAA